ncbi:MAG: VOC family protein [Pseudomonadota bacterium]
MIIGIDHIVLTVRDIEASVAFLAAALQGEAITFAGGRRAVRVGNQKINLQTLGQEPRNHARVGSGDVCFLSDATPDAVAAHLTELGIEILEGPVEKSGAQGPIISHYFSDPDGNLIEIGCLVTEPDQA